MSRCDCHILLKLLRWMTGSTVAFSSSVWYRMFLIVMNKCLAPSLHGGFCLILNHVGAYTRTMNVTMVTKVSDGFLHPTYSRRLAVVSHLERLIAPGFLSDRSLEQSPLKTTELISNQCAK